MGEPADDPRRPGAACLATVQATFIVRLRHERGTPAGEWRGEVEHVQSARLAHFADGAALLAFVSSQLAEAESAPRPSLSPGPR